MECNYIIKTFIILLIFTDRIIGNVIPMDNHKRIKAQISSHSLNRIAVTNDRITQVFGDQDAYEIMIDETLGQVFIKPISDHKEIAISFITAQQATQDLLLKPSIDQEATTILFQNKLSNQNLEKSGKVYKGCLYTEGGTLPDRIIQIIQTWVKSEQVCDLSNPPSHHTHPGCNSELVAWQNINEINVSTWRIRNDTSTDIQLNEETVYQAGDIAIVFEQDILMPNSETKFYIISSIQGGEEKS